MQDVSLQFNIGSISSLSGELSFTFVVSNGGSAHLQLYAFDPSDRRKSGVFFRFDEKHRACVLSRWQGSGSFAASTPTTSRKALRASAGRCNAQLTRLGLYTYHLFSLHWPGAPQCKHRRVIWTLGPVQNGCKKTV